MRMHTEAAWPRMQHRVLTESQMLIRAANWLGMSSSLDGLAMMPPPVWHGSAVTSDGPGLGATGSLSIEAEAWLMELGNRRVAAASVLVRKPSSSCRGGGAG